MIKIIPSDPVLRKMMLPSVIRISDAWERHSKIHPLNRNSSTSSTGVLYTSGTLQLKLEFEEKKI